MKLSKLSVILGVAVALACTSAGAAMPGWTDDAAAALAKAKVNKKWVLLSFTGSDWCPYCAVMDKEVFDTPEFKDYTKDNFELVELDLPQEKPIPQALFKQNIAFLNRYHIEVFPAIIVLDSRGTFVKELEGYQPGGPKILVEKLKQLKS